MTGDPTPATSTWPPSPHSDSPSRCHPTPGISTDSAPGSEATGNNRHDSGKPGTRTGRSTSQWTGPSSRVHDRYIRWPGAELGLANVEPGDRAPDQHPLDLRRALEDREDPGGHWKSHRYTRAGPPIALRMGILMPCPVPRTDSQPHRTPLATHAGGAPADEPARDLAHRPVQRRAGSRRAFRGDPARGVRQTPILMADRHLLSRFRAGLE
jgi:hypothetical protein